MAKHTTKEAFYERLNKLADVKPSVKESQIRNLGTLIDYKRAPDGVAYGIVKENHEYFIKKGGTKKDPNVTDFAYIGGLGNIKDYKYQSLSEADKQRNFIFHDISEAKTLKPNKTKTKMVITEGAKEEIDQATSKVPELDAATSAEKTAPEGSAEMTAGLETEPATGPEAGPETPAGDATEVPAGDATELPADSTEELPADSTEELPASDTEEKPTDTEEKPEGEEELSDMQSKVGKIASEIKSSDLDTSELTWLLKTFVKGFLPNKDEKEDASANKMAKIDDEDRHEVADMILKVVSPEDVADLGDSVPQEKPGEGDLGPSGLPEAQCAECGTFTEYAKSRGVDSAEALMECGEEEVGNMVSGYANAHNDGQNDGDIDNVAMIIKIINPEILNTLKNDYGHEDYANKLEPVVNGMNECSQEEGVAKLNELFGGLKSLGKAAGRGIAKGAQAVGGAIGRGAQAVGGAVQRGAQAVGQVAQAGAEKIGQAGQAIKQTYNAGEVPGEVKKLQGIATNLGQQIQALNTRLTKAGQQPIDVKNILKAVSQQVTGKGAGVAGLNPAVAENVDVANVETQPPQPQAIQELVVPEKKGKPLSTKAPVKIMKEEDEPEGEEIEKGEVDLDDVKDDAGEEKPGIGAGAPKFAFGPDSQNLGVDTIKPESAPMTTVDVNITPDKAVNIQMSEGEKKLRKYIRERLEVKAGVRKESLNESKKSPTLKKLDVVIDNQFKLFEGVVLKKKVNEGAVNEILGFSVAEKLAKLDPNDEAGVKELFQQAFKNILMNPYMSVIGDAANRATTQEKYALLQQYAKGGGGSLRRDQNTGKLVYITKQQQSQGIAPPKGGGSTGLPGI
jgi:hypothetical protein